MHNIYVYIPKRMTWRKHMQRKTREKALKVMDRDRLQQSIVPRKNPKEEYPVKLLLKIGQVFGQSYSNSTTVVSTFSEREEGVSGPVVSSQTHFAKPSVPHAADAACQTLHPCMDPFKKVKEEELSGSFCICTALPYCS